MGTLRDSVGMLLDSLWWGVAALGFALLWRARSRETPAERAEALVTGAACLVLVAEPLFVTIRYWSRILPGFGFW